ncbi:hypothetical protein C5167_035616 [Papaver somniferum]|uniref:J domain-containing protein n=1 Tax=Papaver somniferum TaxID=3469 RepID=A0A4Y7KHA4_PAPSO|nr:hypothetical protein C5167_035616 [Papaver somniferum]
MKSVELEEQQEKLRTIVDDCRLQSSILLNLAKDTYRSPSTFHACPIRVFAEPLEHSSFSPLLELGIAAISKFLAGLSYGCSEISRPSQYARRNINRQLSLFGHGSNPPEMPLEGELQKAFGHVISLFVELSDITRRMSALMCNLLQQLDFIYSLQDMNSPPCKSFKNITLVTSFTSLGDGLAMVLILDEVLANIDHRKNYLSRFYKQVAELIGSCAALLQLRTPSDAEHAISRKAALREMIRNYGRAVKDLPRLISVLEKQAHDKYNQSSSGTSLHRGRGQKAVPFDMYLISGVEASATASDIKKAYRKAARSLYDLEETRNSRKQRKQHNLRMPSSSTDVHNYPFERSGSSRRQRQEVLGKAYQVLSDPVRRLIIGMEKSPVAVFALLFGSELFEDYVGHVAVASMASSDLAGEKDTAEKVQDRTKAKVLEWDYTC